MFRQALILAILVAPSAFPSSAADRPPPSPRRHVEPWGGYSIVLPDGWRATSVDGSEFAVLNDQQGEENSFNHIHVDRIFTDESAEERVEKSYEYYLNKRPGSLRNTIIKQFQTDDGLVGTQLTGTQTFYQEAELHWAFIAVKAGGVLFEILWVGPPHDQPSPLKTIIATVKTFRIRRLPNFAEADGKTRLNESLGGYSFVLPAGWKSRDIAGQPFDAYVSPEDEQPRVITIGRRIAAADRNLDELAEFLVTELLAKPPGGVLLHDSIVIEPFVNDDKWNGRRIQANMFRAKDGAILQLRVYLFCANGYTFEACAFESEEYGERFADEYDAFAKAFHIEGNVHTRVDQ